MSATIKCRAMKQKNVTNGMYSTGAPTGFARAISAYETPPPRATPRRAKYAWSKVWNCAMESPKSSTAMRAKPMLHALTIITNCKSWVLTSRKVSISPPNIGLAPMYLSSRSIERPTMIDCTTK